MGKNYYAIHDSLPKPLSAKDEQEALTNLKVHSDLTAKTLLVEHNLRLVLYIARKFENTEEDIEDLFSIGTIELIKGINTFDISKKIKLATYISRCIENEIKMYLRRQRKWSNDRVISIDEPISTDLEGKILTFINDILPDFKAENALYRSVEIDCASMILSIAFSSLSVKKLLAVLYLFSGMNQRDVEDCISISQSYISRIQRAFLNKMRKIAEYPNKKLKQLYSISQANENDFIFSIADSIYLCLSCHSKFLNSFMEFIEPYKKIKFSTEKDTNRIVIKLPIDESSYFFFAQLIRYLKKI